ncbi:MAG: hypothetical protein JNK35_00610 [Phycisphaerae bacterium]|nr:hypothetical protein [Phycisphaerae bacterium]
MCHDVPFERVRWLRDQGLSLEQIVASTGCTTGCGMCGPYVRLVMRTGRTRFAVLPADEAARIMRESGMKEADAGPLSASDE